MSGWICSYRAIWEHPLFEGCAWRVGVWDWMLKKAAWQDRKFRVNGKVIDLKRGELCVSQRQIEDETGVGRTALRTFFDELEGEKAITRRPTHGATQARTIITICKYDNYQARDKPANPAANQEPTQAQPIKEHLNTLTPTPVGEADASQTISVSVVTTALWSAGKQYLSSQQIKSPGAVIGKWLKTSDPLMILNAIEAAQRSGTQDPIPYITEILKGGFNDQPSTQTLKQSQRDQALADEILAVARAR